MKKKFLSLTMVALLCLTLLPVTAQACPNLTSVTIRSSHITWINDFAFSYCPKLADVYCGGSEEQWNSIYIDKNKVVVTLQAKEPAGRYKSQITLAQRRVSAFKLALELIDRELEDTP